MHIFYTIRKSNSYKKLGHLEHPIDGEGYFWSKLLNAIQRHIRMNIPYYFIVILFFAIGVVAGTYTVKALRISKRSI